MAKERLSMRKIKEVLRLCFEHQQSIRQIAQSCNIARSTVQEYLHRAEQAGVNWPLPPEMDDAALEKPALSSSGTDSPGKNVRCRPWSIFTRNARRKA